MERGKYRNCDQNNYSTLHVYKDNNIFVLEQLSSININECLSQENSFLWLTHNFVAVEKMGNVNFLCLIRIYTI